MRRLNQRGLVCLAAPAGYGKTTLLTEYARRECSRDESGRPHRAWPKPARSNGALRPSGFCVWYALDESDRDVSSLLAGLAASLGERPPLDFVSPGPGLGWLCRRLEHHTGATLILDDVHVLDGAVDALRLLGELLVGLPEHARIILAGRFLPPIPTLPRQRLTGQVLDLGPEDLAFTADECRSLVVAAGGDERTAERVQEVAQGWPVALRLLAATSAPSRLPRAGLFDYLAAEVLSGLPETQRRLLLDISVLPEWSVEACDAVVLPPGSGAGGESAANAILEDLCRRQLPIAAGPAGELRPHPLWREFLLRELRREPDRHRTLERRAALWRMSRGEPEMALEHALAVGDAGLIEPLLRRAGTELLRSGRLQRLEDWLEAAPEPVLDVLPDLLSAAGEALRRSGHPRRALRWLRRAVVSYAGATTPGGLLRALCRLAAALADLGEWDEASVALRQIQAELPEADQESRAEALMALGQERAARGMGAESAACFDEAAMLFASGGDHERAAVAQADLAARAFVLLDRAEEALSLLQQAGRILAGAEAGDALLAEAEILAQAERWGTLASLLHRVAPAGSPQQALLHWLHARLVVHQGDLFEAGRLWDLGEACLVDTERTPGLQCASLVARAWLERASGNPGGAATLARQALRLAESAGAPLLRRAAQQAVDLCEPEATPLPDRLQVFCLGAFALRQGGQELAPGAWGRAQVRGLFQYLLLQPGFVAAREAVLEAFWPGEAAESSRRVLRVTLHRLRQALQSVDGDVEASQDQIRLKPGSIGWVDFLAFRSQLAAARRTAVSDPAACLESCRAGRALYRGDLLADVFWPWAEEHRRSLRRQMAELLQLWQEAARRLGRTEEALEALEDLVALDPGQENAFRDLILLLAASGQRRQALMRYREYARWLKLELGVSPSPGTRAALRRALQD
ncbi:MAG: BTAD domain-containing putative transcriptional regulator [Symbiobacteriia bacterium]